MKKRFEGDNRPALVEIVSRSALAGNDARIAEAIIETGHLVEFRQGEAVIAESGADNDVFLIIAGNVSVMIRGTEVRTLAASDHVGEMAAIEPSQPRSATVIALDTVIALKVPPAAFLALCDRFPGMWKPIARELAHRLYDRNRHMAVPNERPRLFILSSVEALDIARAIQNALERDALCTVWTDGVFWPSTYPLEKLEQAVQQSDFGIAVATFDDVVEVRGERHPTMRDNVLFELGMFMGQLGRHRTVLVHPRLKNLKLPSDLYGLTPASYDPGSESELPSRIAPACNEIRTLIRRLGVRKGPAK